MNIKRLFAFAAFILVTKILPAQQVQMTMVDTSHQVISKYIYGHFAEDLGRCIYDGFWVDSSLKVAKNDRLRLDVIDALTK